jgi:hypothetical protein
MKKFIALAAAGLIAAACAPKANGFLVLKAK